MSINSSCKISMDLPPQVSQQRFKACIITHLILNKGSHTLLLLRQNTGYADNFYSLIAGHVDGGESIIAATLREAKEEANLDLVEDDLQFGCVVHRLESEIECIDFFFIAKQWSNTIKNAEPDKCKELRFFPTDNLPMNMVPHVLHALNCIQQGIYQTTFGW